ncbi:MAG: alkaline phosphatase family protein [Gammaproteobacteria bacterium]
MSALQAIEHLRPDYGGGSSINLLVSLFQGLGWDQPGFPYPAHRDIGPEVFSTDGPVVLVVLDGLGFHYLNRCTGALREGLRGAMDTVFPPTTATAVTSLFTGVGPQQHAQTGWFTWYRELGTVAATLPLTTRVGWIPLHTGKLDLSSLFPQPTVFGSLPLPCDAVMPAYLAGSTYTRLHTRGARVHPYGEQVENFFERAAEVVRVGGRRYVHAYWPGYDALAHEHGVHSEEVARHFERMDRAFADFMTRIQGSGATVVVTADHGFIDTRPDLQIHLDQHPGIAECLAVPLCGEPRTAWCYLRPGFETRFQDRVGHEFADAMIAVPSEALVEQGWFGLGDPHPALRERIGDYALIARGAHTLKDSVLGEGPFHMTGVHGGVSEEELKVPMVLTRA